MFNISMSITNFYWGRNPNTPSYENIKALANVC